jgi:hypothetical protein
MSSVFHQSFILGYDINHILKSFEVPFQTYQNLSHPSLISSIKCT